MLFISANSSFFLYVFSKIQVINLDYGKVSFLEQLGLWLHYFSPGSWCACCPQLWWVKSDTAFIFLTGVRFFFFNMESPYLTGLSSLHPYDSFALECNRACSCLVCLHCCHCIWGRKDETLTKYWTFRSCGIRCTNCREQLWPKVYCLSIFCLFFPLPKPALLSSMWNSDRFAPWVHAFWDWWNGVWVLIAVFEWAAGQRSECYLLFMLSVS